ncbi:MAG: BatB protein [Rhodospirillaceae bacterium]|nr:BatB protein [Rhodospirillaceae bacterium]
MWSLAWWWVLLAFPVPWLVRYLSKADNVEREAALKVPEPQEYAGLTGGSAQSGFSNTKLLMLWTIWGLALIAAARPQYLGEPTLLPVTGRDLLLAVDLSGSMEEQDFQLNGQYVDRLTATKSVAKEFIDRRIGDRIGLILFGRETYLQTPLTFDRKTVQTLLDEAIIGLAGKETAIGDAIGLSIKTLADANVEESRRVLVLLTDGANTSGAVDPLKAADLARDRGMVIYSIGIGADALMVRSLFGVRQINPSADLDEQTLTTIAEGTGGRYFRARDTEELQQIYAILDELEPAADEEEGFRPVVQYFYWPLGLAVVLSVIWAITGLRRKTSVLMTGDRNG